MGHVGDRDQTQHSRDHPQQPSHSGQGPLFSTASTFFTDVHQVQSRYS